MPTTVPKPVDLKDFNFRFKERTSIIKYDTLLTGIEIVATAEEAELMACDPFLMIKPDSPQTDFDADFQEYLTPVDSERPYQAWAKLFYVDYEMADCVKQVQISIIAHTLQAEDSLIRSGFTTFLMSEEFRTE